MGRSSAVCLWFLVLTGQLLSLLLVPPAGLFARCNFVLLMLFYLDFRFVKDS